MGRRSIRHIGSARRPRSTLPVIGRIHRRIDKGNRHVKRFDTATTGLETWRLPRHRARRAARHRPAFDRERAVSRALPHL